jgi:predicted RNA-binding Zn-ribbon protein involved in translation (DUF1610 family)
MAPKYTDLQEGEHFGALTVTRTDLLCPLCHAKLTLTENFETGDGYYRFTCPACTQEFVLRVETVRTIEPITWDVYRAEARVTKELQEKGSEE